MNTITIELCAEDRKRLDDLAYGLGVLAGLISQAPKVEAGIKKEEETPAEAATTAQEAKKETTQANQANTQPGEENAPKAIPEAVEAVEEAKPSITLAQIQQKVVQLSANANKKATVRTIIFAYGTKVSDLKDQPEKWEEVWEKLTALESEA